MLGRVEYRKLGPAGLGASRLGPGGLSVGAAWCGSSPRSMDEDAGRPLTRRAVDRPRRPGMPG
jgi:hypothetical protein